MNKSQPDYFFGDIQTLYRRVAELSDQLAILQTQMNGAPREGIVTPDSLGTSRACQLLKVTRPVLMRYVNNPDKPPFLKLGEHYARNSYNHLFFSISKCRAALKEFNMGG